MRKKTRAVIQMTILVVMARTVLNAGTTVIGQINPPGITAGGISGITFDGERDPLVIDGFGQTMWRLDINNAMAISTFRLLTSAQNTRSLDFDTSAGQYYTSRRRIASTDYLSTVNPLSGTVTDLGVLGTTFNFLDMAIDPLTGDLWLANDCANLGCTSVQGASLWKVDKLTGSATPVQTFGLRLGQLTAFAISPQGQFFVAGLATSGSTSIWQIDPLTGSSTFVADTGLTIQLSRISILVDLAFDPSTNALYAIEWRISGAMNAWYLDQVALSNTWVQFIVGSNTSPSSINGNGQIVGSYGDSQGPRHGFVRDPGGTITTLVVPGSSQTIASSINNEGVITGTYSYTTSVQGPYHAYVRDPEGNLTTFDPPGSISTSCCSINVGGAVTGNYQDSNNVYHGFVRRADGTLITFDPPGSITTLAASINTNGDITGSYQDANGLHHSFVRRSGGEIVSFDVPGSTMTTAVGINDGGAIMGAYVAAANGRSIGFVRDPQGNFTSFDPGPLTFPYSINNEGAITGYQSGASGKSSGFVRSPAGTITLLDQPSFCAGSVTPTSINEGGVITGNCAPPGQLASVGWVRIP